MGSKDLFFSSSFDIRAARSLSTSTDKALVLNLFTPIYYIIIFLNSSIYIYELIYNIKLYHITIFSVDKE